MKPRVVFFGSGGRYALVRRMDLTGVDLVAVLDNDPAKQGTSIHGVPLLPPSELPNLEFDRLFILSAHYQAIRAQLRALGVDMAKVLCLDPLPTDSLPPEIPATEARPWEQSLAGHLQYVESLRNRSFSLISDNCWGGIVCQALGLPYRSPFVGMFILPQDYLNLVADLAGHLALPLEFDADPGLPYPIGVLGDVRIHFNHYADAEDAGRKWRKRVQRIDPENLFVKFGMWSDRPDLARAFLALDLPRSVCLTSLPDLEGAVFMPELQGATAFSGAVNEYNVSWRRMDVVAWLNQAAGS